MTAEPLARWKCTSYCLCPPSKNQGHFERSDDGVWVRYADIGNNHIYCWLGVWRDKLPPEAVEELQNILGPMKYPEQSQ